jgi:hypothetical protein
MTGQPIETAPPNTRLLVLHPLCKGWTLGIRYDQPYHNRGAVGWKVSLTPADRWQWVRTPPTHWMPLPAQPG